MFSHSVMSNSLEPQLLQHTRLPCPLSSPGVCSNSCPLSQWCHPTISSSVIPFSSRLHLNREYFRFIISPFQQARMSYFPKSGQNCSYNPLKSPTSLKSCGSPNFNTQAIPFTVLLHGYNLRPHVLGEKWAREHTTLKNKLISSGTGPISGTACPKWLRILIPAPSTKGILILVSQIEKIGFFHSFPSIMKWKVLRHTTINAESHNDYFMGWKTQMNTYIVVTLCYCLTTHQPSPLLLV